MREGVRKGERGGVSERGRERENINYINLYSFHFKCDLQLH